MNTEFKKWSGHQYADIETCFSTMLCSVMLNNQGYARGNNPGLCQNNTEILINWVSNLCFILSSE